MTQGSIARIFQIPKMQVDQTPLRPIFIPKTAPMLIIVGRNLVSTFKIELVTPICISIDVDLVQSFEIVLPDNILWIKAPIKPQNAIYRCHNQNSLLIRPLRQLSYFPGESELKSEESRRVEHSDYPYHFRGAIIGTIVLGFVSA